MINFKETPPATLDEAIERVVSKLDEKEIDFIKNNDYGLLHHTLGMAMRNNWGLWKLDSKLNTDIRTRYNIFGHGDDCSGLIFVGVWAKVRGEDVEAALKATVKRYVKHWTEQGLDPVTGKQIKKKRK